MNPRNLRIRPFGRYSLCIESRAHWLFPWRVLRSPSFDNRFRDLHPLVFLSRKQAEQEMERMSDKDYWAEYKESVEDSRRIVRKLYSSW